MTLIDEGELGLLRSTARKLFEGGASVAEIGELGLMSLLTAEEHGGAGWRMVEACTVAAEAGRALSPAAWTGGLVAAAALAGMAGSQADALLTGAATAVVLTHGIAADPGGEGARVSGRAVVAGSAVPDVLLVATDRGIVAGRRRTCPGRCPRRGRLARHPPGQPGHRTRRGPGPAGRGPRRGRRRRAGGRCGAARLRRQPRRSHRDERDRHALPA